MSEVERFDAYYGYPSCRANGRHIHANGEFVLASDYDALAAELARVKAESLRVVPDGLGLEYRNIPPGVVFSAEGITAMKSGDRSPFSSMEDAWVFGESYHTTVFKGDTIVQPVRLERWGNSNEAD